MAIARELDQEAINRLVVRANKLGAGLGVARLDFLQRPSPRSATPAPCPRYVVYGLDEWRQPGVGAVAGFDRTGRLNHDFYVDGTLGVTIE